MSLGWLCLFARRKLTGAVCYPVRATTQSILVDRFPEATADSEVLCSTAAEN